MDRLEALLASEVNLTDERMMRSRSAPISRATTSVPSSQARELLGDIIENIDPAIVWSTITDYLPPLHYTCAGIRGV